MYSFNELNKFDRIRLVKAEFMSLVSLIFNNPEQLKVFVENKQLSIGQAKNVFRTVNSFNSNSCFCCRKFDQRKVLFHPIDQNLQPIIDIAQSILQNKKF